MTLKYFSPAYLLSVLKKKQKKAVLLYLISVPFSSFTCMNLVKKLPEDINSFKDLNWQYYPFIFVLFLLPLLAYGLTVFLSGKFQNAALQKVRVFCAALATITGLYSFGTAFFIWTLPVLIYLYFIFREPLLSVYLFAFF